MAPIAIVFGVLLMALGASAFVQTDMEQKTALIPAYFGIALLVLGVIALSDKARKHAMHVAALLGLVGFAMPAFMVIRAIVVQGQTFEPLKHGEQTAMSALCLIFLVLCVKSFINARSARKAKEAETPAA